MHDPCGELPRGPTLHPHCTWRPVLYHSLLYRKMAGIRSFSRQLRNRVDTNRISVASGTHKGKVFDGHLELSERGLL